VDTELYLIIRLSDDGKAYATSPQAPGLAYGRPSLQELRADLGEVLEFHFGHPGPFTVVEHIEHHYDLAGGELVIRVAMDAHTAERESVAERIRQVANVPEQARSLVLAANAVGEAVYVCAVSSDTLGWLEAQLTGPADMVNAALPIAEGFLFTLPVAADARDRSAWAVSSATPETQLAEIMQRTPILTPQQPVSLEAC
jgi:predicted RNase H-like HicB family nuclease